MDESAESVSKVEGEIKAGDDGVPKKNEAEAERSSEPAEEKEKEEKSDSGSVPEDGPTFDSFVKPLVEELTQEAKALVGNVIPSSSDVTEVEKEVEKMVLVSDPWAALKSLGDPPHSQTPESSEPLPTSDENVGESSEAAAQPSGNEEPEKAGSVVNPRGTKSQPFVAVTAGTRASWMNCCGLLDVFSRSDQ